MAWVSSGIGVSNSDWVLGTPSSPNRMNIKIGKSINSVYTLSYVSSAYAWKSSKTYQFNTTVVSFYATAASFSFTPGPWTDNFAAPKLSSNPSVNQHYFLYSTPPSNVTSPTYITYKANGTFSYSRGIIGLTATEIDFQIQGYSYYKADRYEGFDPLYSGVSASKSSLGWYYDKTVDSYYWYDAIDNLQYPVGGSNNNKIANVGYRQNNYIAKYIQYSNFNLTFDYQNNNPNNPVKIYLSNTLPTTVPGSYSPPSGSILLGTLTQSNSGTYSSIVYAISQAFYGLRGNKYIYFVGPNIGPTSLTSSFTYSAVYISKIKIEGGYHPGNNRQYLLTNSGTYSNPTTLSPIGLTGATYSAYVGQGNTVNATQSLSVSQVFSKIGNGKFKAGVWENGVWNSGWRVDEGMYEFYDVYQHFAYNRLKKWRIQIQGPTSSVTNFEVGDNISIGNIVAIDINDDRRLLKNYFTIINKTDDTIIVEFDNDFPLRRIERDSENHRIYVTKNVWLSGGFLNGYFKGIWNYGLFKGYPLITEMYDSHWIDGVFDGGHFNTIKYPSVNFVDTLYYLGSDNLGYVGLTFSSKHGLVVNDIIDIDKTDKTINPEYDGEHTITKVINDYHVVTDIEWASNSSNEGGTASVNKSKGLIQKMSFKSNNKSRITSIQSDRSESVFTFNSWIDVNYDDSSAVNIGKPQNLLNNLSKKTYSENNLYGYPTLDVLESDSTFRDSFSTTIRKYRLGTKYKIFDDFIGDSGQFENYFDRFDESRFIAQGWTFSRVANSSLTFSRTQDTGVYPLIGEELRVQSIGNGGVLDFTNVPNVYNIFGREYPFTVPNKSYEEIEKNRYTKVEFDLVSHSNLSGSYYGVDTTNEYIIPSIPAYGIVSNDGLMSLSGTLANTSELGDDFLGFTTVPVINFDNINKVTRDVYYNYDSVTYSTVLDATFLPVYKNVNHLNTSKTKKTEYFFNKRNLSMRLYGNNNGTTVDYVIDNLHYYEIDMVPFFQYFTEDTINKGVEIPFQGISPFIDYTNANFNFIDNIAIGLDSIQTQNSNTVVSGVGVGIGTVTSGSGTIYQEYALAVLAGAFAYSPSDIRLKENIVKVGQSLSGLNIYEWNFIGKSSRNRGVIAQELIGTEFENALCIKEGFYHVNYSTLDVKYEVI